MSTFNPTRLFVDKAIANTPVAQRIINKFPHLKPQWIEDTKDIKLPLEHTLAKKDLYLAEFKGAAIKTCQGLGDYVCCQYYTISLVSDCHLECTYCILQDYLKNNPRITIYCNKEEIFEAVSKKAKLNPQRILRVGTGELSDSLALDSLHEFSKDYVAFANENPNVLIELKTKTNCVENLLPLKHNKRVIVSFSVNPESYIAKEEFKCATLAERVKAARQCADKGYPVAFHFDPLLHLDNWQNEYTEVVRLLSEQFLPKEIAWISIGSLRFTPGLKKIAQARFPKSEAFAGELFPSADGKTRYFRLIREEMYSFLKSLIETKLKKVPYYLCMETSTVWKNVFQEPVPSNKELEDRLTINF